MRLNVEQSELANGLRVATAQMPQVESLALGVWVGTGGRYEPAALSGVSHFIEHLLFKGTRRRSARAIAQAIEGRGGYFNAYTQEDATCYYARVAAGQMPQVLDILADMYRAPRFAAADIAKERGVIVEEIMMYRDQPQQVVMEKLGELLWKGQALGRPLIGTERTVRAMRRADIRAYKASHYVPANTLVVGAGQVRHAEFVRQAERWLGAVPRRPRPACAACGPQAPQQDVAVLLKDIEQVNVALGFRLFGRHDERRYALKLLSIILGENMSSRLFHVVRERHGLAYSIHSSADLFAETGVFSVEAGVDRRRAARALALIFAELARVKERPVGARELRRAKDYALGQLRIGLESTTNQMAMTGEHLLHHGRLIQPEEIERRLEAVSVAELRAVAEACLTPERLSVALIGPRSVTPTAEQIRRMRRVL